MDINEKKVFGAKDFVINIIELFVIILILGGE